jgi:hypothetical protein
LVGEQLYMTENEILLRKEAFEKKRPLKKRGL